MENISFVIIELKNNLIVDFAQSLSHAAQKCSIAKKCGCDCLFYEIGINSLDVIKQTTKNLDLNSCHNAIKIDSADSLILQS